MSKRKFRIGDRITSVTDAVALISIARTRIYVVSPGRPSQGYDPGWAMSWPLRHIVNLVDGGVLFRAVSIGEDNDQ